MKPGIKAGVVGEILLFHVFTASGRRHISTHKGTAVRVALRRALVRSGNLRSGIDIRSARCVSVALQFARSGTRCVVEQVKERAIDLPCCARHSDFASAAAGVVAFAICSGEIFSFTLVADAVSSGNRKPRSPRRRNSRHFPAQLLFHCRPAQSSRALL